MVRSVITLGSQSADRTAQPRVTAVSADTGRVATSPTVAGSYRGGVAIACSGYPPRIPVRAVATSSSKRLRGVAAARPVPMTHGGPSEQKPVQRGGPRADRYECVQAEGSGAVGPDRV